MSDHFTELFARAQLVIPGGVNSPVRAFKGVGGNPIFIQSGKGAYIFDNHNKKYIDCVLSWGPLILGHAHPEVIQAVKNAMENGLGFGAPTQIEVELAELITRRMPNIEKIRMVNSGTEATQTAIRLARGFTGRDKIVKFAGCYHGHVDSLLVKAGSGGLTFDIPDSAGIPNDFAKHTLTAPYNDLDAVMAIFEKYGHEIAAIIVEPIAGNMNCVPPLPHFLSGLRAICDQYQSLLIFDEVITGFRVDKGGAQALYNIKPDLTCLGKIIGGGLPVGAFGGKKNIMDSLAPLGKVYQAGTLSGNPIALTAGYTTLKILEDDNIYKNLASQAKYLLENFKKLASHHGIPLLTQSVGSLFGFFFTEKEAIINYDDLKYCNVKAFQYFFHHMLSEGVYFAPSAFESSFLSIMHDQSVLDYILSASEKVFKTWMTKPLPNF